MLQASRRTFAYYLPLENWRRLHRSRLINSSPWGARSPLRGGIRVRFPERSARGHRKARFSPCSPAACRRKGLAVVEGAAIAVEGRRLSRILLPAYDDHLGPPIREVLSRPTTARIFGRRVWCCVPHPPARIMASSLAFFDYDEGDVVGLRHALSEFLNGFQERLLDRATSGRCFLPNECAQPFLSEHFVPRVLRVRQAVGIHHQDVSFVQVKRAGW